MFIDDINGHNRIDIERSNEFWYNHRKDVRLLATVRVVSAVSRSNMNRLIFVQDERHNLARRRTTMANEIL